MRRTLFAACAVVALAACGTDPEAVTTGPAQQPDGTTTTTTTPDVTVGPPTPEAVGLAVPDGCDPWGPFHAVASTYGGEPATVGAAVPRDGSIDVLAKRFDAPDTDGDGAADVVQGETGQVDVRRGDGTVTLARTGGSVGTPGGQRWTGDLDGDGRDELLVFATNRSGGGTLEVYLVPGTVAVGQHDPADVGILLPWEPNFLVWAVGDHDGDGADDVAVPADSGAVVVTGPSLLAPGPGGTVGADDLDRLRDAPMGFLGVLELAPGASPVFVTATDVGGDPATRIEVQVLTDPPLRLRIGGLEAIGGGWGSFGSASGYRSGGDLVVTYEFSGGRSGYGATWHWNLDQPCLAPAPAPAGPSARPLVETPNSIGAVAVLPATG